MNRNHLSETFRRLRERAEQLRKGKVRIQVWWEDEHGKPPVWHEHEIEFVERWHEQGIPDPKTHVLLKLDSKEVKVERFTIGDWRERMARAMAGGSEERTLEV